MARQVQARRQLQPDQIRKASDYLPREEQKAQPLIHPRDRKEAPGGYRTTIFACPSFVVQRQVLQAGGSIPWGLHKTADRFISVQAGELNVLVIDEAGEPAHRTASPGVDVKLPAGFRYALSAPTTSDVVMQVSQTPNYEDGFELLNDPTGQAELRAAQREASAPPQIASSAQFQIAQERMARNGGIISPQQAAIPTAAALNAPLNVAPPQPRTLTAAQLAEIG